MNTVHTFEEICCRGGTGRSVWVSGTGRDKKFSYRTGITCALGDIETAEWKKMVQDTIAQAGEQKLFQQLLEFEREHNYCRRTKEELETHVLKLHSMRIFDDPLWVSYVAFNRKYRPEVLSSIKLVTVIPECCKKPGRITKARLDSNSNGYAENYCPHCGRWTPIQIMKDIVN